MYAKRICVHAKAHEQYDLTTEFEIVRAGCVRVLCCARIVDRQPDSPDPTGLMLPWNGPHVDHLGRASVRAAFVVLLRDRLVRHSARDQAQL